MKLRHAIAATFMLAALSLALVGIGRAGDKDSSLPSANANANHAAQDDPLRLEGEKRFHANCGRCHAAPPKFPSRMMATIIRHMRVRATITNDDMRLILHYMSE